MTDWLDNLERPKPKVRVGKAYKGMPLERTIQRDIIRALRQLGFIVKHTANEGRLDGDEKARMLQGVARKRDGLIRGWPDLEVLPGRSLVGFVEVKRPGGYLSDAQLACIAMLERKGYPCAAVCTVDDALKAIKEWGWI